MTHSTSQTAPSSNTPTNRSSNGLAIAALVCGLVGLVFFSIILGPLALIFGLVALNKAKHGAAHRGMAIAGTVLGLVDIVLFVVLVALAADNGGYFSFTVG
ncbi:DUF4190 domain-containing protein [Modestobacter italicus]|uniref:DUF4190 domain-containing protein n=1 Tax=Modestobacter italicus (strain DSM 44449 / CECT 9708 / BC 501) TaxID=2732864 RepID=UPI001C978305|nr:DUF4190 domain-containing protein [Modestobacter italicus]